MLKLHKYSYIQANTNTSRAHWDMCNIFVLDVYKQLPITEMTKQGLKSKIISEK